MRDVSKELQKINADALRKDLLGIVALSSETTTTGASAAAACRARPKLRAAARRRISTNTRST